MTSQAGQKDLIFRIQTRFKNFYYFSSSRVARIFEASSKRILMQPAIGMATIQPINPKAYIPIVIEIKIASGGRLSPLP